MLTPLELIERLAALIPPPRRHRYRTYGVLAPLAPLRGQVTALAGTVPDGTPAAAATESIAPSAAATARPSRSSEGTEEAPGEEEAIPRRAARYAWALLLARIDEVFPLLRPRCGGEMRIISFLRRNPLHPEPLGRTDLAAALDARARTSALGQGRRSGWSGGSAG